MVFITLLIFIGLSVGLAWYLIAHDRGEKEPIAALWMAAGFGVFAAIIVAGLEAKFIPDTDQLVGQSNLNILWAMLGVGVIEEACKFVPLALFLYRKRYFNEHTDGIIYFALAGLGFGLPENILYTMQYGTEAGKARLLLTPIFHAAITGMVGYFLIKGKLVKHSPWRILVPLSIAMLLHGLYDFGLTAKSDFLSLMSVVITLGLSGGLFWLFLRATQQDQDQGLSAVGHNNFCRSCGCPNPQHHLYCVQCGKNA
jgi:RsiW-degrading membrane proteinase PrsW (M82 family)